MTARLPAAEHAIGRGIILRCMAALGFSIMSALMKAASDRGVVAPEMLFYRAVFGLPVVALWVHTGAGWQSIRTRRPLVHVGRSALGISSILLTFEALVLLPLADATTLAFTAPIFATILSAAVLGEAVGRHRWGAVALGFAGVAVVVGPSGAGLAIPATGIAIALAAALGTAAVTVTLRQLGGSEHAQAIVWWFFTGSAIMGGLLMPAFGHRHDLATLTLLAGAGIAGAAGQITMTTSLRHASVAVLSPFDYLQIVGATVLGWALLGSVPTPGLLAGAALIAASGVYTAWRERRLRRTAMR